MNAREMLLRLASHQSPNESAISFYFQPATPRDKSHRDEFILIKDLVREAQRGNGRPSANDLARVAALSERLMLEHTRARAIFACEELGVWEEVEIPAQHGRTELIVNRRFHLRPLAMAIA